MEFPDLLLLLLVALELPERLLDLFVFLLFVLLLDLLSELLLELLFEVWQLLELLFDASVVSFVEK